MPTTVFKLVAPQIYDDDARAPAQLNLDHLAESFRIADLLKQLGHDDAATFVKPVHMIAGFTPAALVDRLSDIAAHWDFACIACLNSEKLPEFIWYPCPNGVNQLVKLRLDGGHVLGIIGLNQDGSFTTYPEDGPDEPLSATLLNIFASGYQRQPEWTAAAQILALETPDRFEPQNVEETLDAYSAFTDAHLLDIHEEISTVPVQNEVV